MNKLAKFLMMTSVVLMSMPSSAALLTIGELSRDESSNIVFDSANNTEWMMWDYQQAFTWDSLNTALNDSSSSFFGWSIAGLDDVLSFLSSANFRGTWTDEASCTDTAKTPCDLKFDSREAHQQEDSSTLFYDLMFGSKDFYKDTYSYGLFQLAPNSVVNAPAGREDRNIGSVLVNEDRAEVSIFPTQYTESVASSLTRRAIDYDPVRVVLFRDYQPPFLPLRSSPAFGPALPAHHVSEPTSIAMITLALIALSRARRS
ncbi:hypothetical protein [Echinimonas agarilytica]|uniref:PEP-CTERM protein-sorting domain-containing protein n=1 Tax=Echinimonas agarilytica TaxID=1215918 RepID=A0AA41W6H8_9GAMM|nr:hypothetical protein [Echinimonas agarilytica]MCM2679782.1 hypothetical protein [Echinimonas agarilytica]